MQLHNQKNQKPQEGEKTLRIMQTNIVRGGLANDLALALAFEDEIDIFLIQNSWIGVDLEKKLFKKYRGHQAYAPKKEWKKRPRVIMYIRRQNLLRPIKKEQNLFYITNKTLDM